jgi:microcystin-dependent protein
MANVSLIANIADQTASQASNGSAQLVPTGVILSYGGASAPTGWLLCDGSAVSRTTFAGLFAVLSTSFGVGDGSTTFNLPDLRGRFSRYDDNMGNHGISGVTASGAASRDTGRVHGSAQTQATAKNGLSNSASTATGTANGQSFSGTTGTSTVPSSNVSGADNATALSGSANSSINPQNNSGGHSHSFSGTSGASSISSGSAAAQTITGDAETRPINVAVNAIIKI